MYGNMPKPKDGPKDLLEMLSGPQNPNIPQVNKTVAGGGFMMPPPRVATKPSMMLPPSMVKRATPSGGAAVASGAPASAPGTTSRLHASLATVQTVAVVAKKAEGSSEGGALEPASIVQPSAAGSADDDESDPYNPSQPNDYMAFCRERCEEESLSSY